MFTKDKMDTLDGLMLLKIAENAVSGRHEQVTTKWRCDARRMAVRAHGRRQIYVSSLSLHRMKRTCERAIEQLMPPHIMQPPGMTVAAVLLNPTAAPTLLQVMI